MLMAACTDVRCNQEPPSFDTLMTEPFAHLFRALGAGLDGAQPRHAGPGDILLVGSCILACT